MRGIAAFGILLINIAYFGLAYQYDNIQLNNETGLNFDLWWWLELWFEGTMRALFSILFGASTVLLIRKLEERKRIQSPVSIYYRRLFWLWIFGLVNAYIFLWDGDILYTYAIAGIFLYPLRRLKPVWLLSIGLFVLFIASFIATLESYNKKYLRIRGEQAIAMEKDNKTLTEIEKQAKYDWIKYQNENSRDAKIHEANRVTEARSGGYFSSFWFGIPVVFDLQTNGFVSIQFWDALCFFLIGMALFKWGLLTGDLPKLVYWVMLIVGYGIGLLFGTEYLNSLLETGFDKSLIADRMPWDLYQLKRLFMCMGHLGLIILLYKSGLFKRVFNLFSKVGQMAFTNYLMQTIICGFIFNILGLFGELQRYQLYFVMIGVWIFEIFFSVYWLKRHSNGPFEWMWRWLIYRGKVPEARLVG